MERQLGACAATGSSDAVDVGLFRGLLGKSPGRPGSRAVVAGGSKVTPQGGRMTFLVMSPD